jgi:hypothetical protein
LTVFSFFSAAVQQQFLAENLQHTTHCIVTLKNKIKNIAIEFFLISFSKFHFSDFVWLLLMFTFS